MEIINQTGKIQSANFKLDQWMKDLQNKIGDRPLSHVIIPGTHDSGTYDLKIYGASKTQNVNFSDQLLLGARFLDLRIVRRYNTRLNPIINKEYFIHHGSKNTGIKLKVALDQIKTFIDSKESEIVIIGVTTSNTGISDFDNILEIFVEEFKGKIAPRDYSRTHCIKDLQAKKYQIVLFWNWNGANDYPHKYQNLFWRMDLPQSDFVELWWTNNDVKYAWSGADSHPGNFYKTLKAKIENSYIENLSFVIQGVVPSTLANKKNWWRLNYINIHANVGEVHRKFKSLVKETLAPEMWKLKGNKTNLLNIIIVDFFDECNKNDFITQLISYNEHLPEIKTESTLQ